MTAGHPGLYSSGVLRSVCSGVMLIGLLSGAAAAQSKSALSWVREPGAEQCIGTVELGQRVERLVGPMLVPAPEGQVSVEGRIARGPRGGFVAEITVADESGKVLGHRQLKREGDDCRALDDELAFVLAVAIDPNAALAELPGELSAVEDPGGELLADMRAAPAAAGAAAAAAGSAAAAAAATARGAAGARKAGVSRAAGAQLMRTREPEPPPFWRVALEPAIAFGHLPDVAVGMQFGVAAAFSANIQLWLRGSAWLPQEVPVPGDAAVSIGAFGVTLALCPLVLEDAPWSLHVCAGGVVNALVAEPVRFGALSKSTTSWRVVPELELRGGIAAGAGFWIGLSSALQTHWPRHEIVYRIAQLNETRSVYTPSLVSSRLALLLELRF